MCTVNVVTPYHHTTYGTEDRKTEEFFLMASGIPGSSKRRKGSSGKPLGAVKERTDDFDKRVGYSPAVLIKKLISLVNQIM